MKRCGVESQEERMRWLLGGLSDVLMIGVFVGVAYFVWTAVGPLVGLAGR